MTRDPVITTMSLGFPWQTLDPFLFCVHHLDYYPKGNEQMGPAASLVGRRIGMDFEIRDGWRMYHGDVVPGFPQHPHRGFETITVARQGVIDHADSMGATARFGQGDVQWMTAGRGVVHSEMFPLRHRDESNTNELFQIWLNLPRKSKMVKPHFTMFWADQVPSTTFRDASGAETLVTVIAGELDGVKPPSPPPDSWANHPDSQVAIWTLKMDPGATWTIPGAVEGLHRILYVFDGDVTVAGHALTPPTGAQLRSDSEVVLVNGGAAAELLFLQGRPIGEPVVQRGPFVMNTPAEIRQTMLDYQRTQFGGWPWDNTGPVHTREQGRFARHADGSEEEPAN